MNIKRVVLKPVIVDACQLPSSDDDLTVEEYNQIMQEIADWCGGEYLQERSAIMLLADGPADYVANETDWVVKYPSGYFVVYTDERFNEEFDCPPEPMSPEELLAGFKI